MAHNLSFNVKVYLENEGVLPELNHRMLHLSPAFQAIFYEWTKLNVQKFEQSVGSEMSGAQVFEEEWAPVTAAYYRQKHQQGTARVTKKAAKGGKASFEGGFPDWLMVRTGALREAMINPDALFNMIQDDQAIFGTPEDADLANIVMWQAGGRQKNRYVVFLSDPDVNAIKRIIQDYFSMGGDFEQIRSEKGLAAARRKNESEEMDAEFDAAVNASTGDWGF